MITLLKIFLRLLLSVIVLAFAFSFAYNRWIDTDATGSANELALSGEFTTIDDVTMHYEVAGSGVETVILLHGSGSSTYTWRGIMDDLAITYRVVAIDLAGFGYSSKGAEINYRTEARVDRIISFMDTAGIIKAHIIGHDTGANLALALAEDYSDRVDRLVLISPMTYRKSFPIPGVFLRIPQISGAAVKLTHSDTQLEERYRDMFVDESRITSADVEAYIRPYNVVGTEAALVAMNTQRDELSYDVTNPISPTLIIYGEKDRIVPRVDVDRLRADMYSAEAVFIENTGHLPQEEQPEIVVEEVGLFLGKDGI